MDRLTAYKIMELAEDADEEQVKAAYKSLAQKYTVENYEAGPLKAEAEVKMQELNQAFDFLMGYLRTGQENTDSKQSTSSHVDYPVNGNYPEIRQLINNNQIDEALAELGALPNGQSNAEWNFLMGSAYYYKGWLDQAFNYFSQAVRLDPTNREYAAAMRNLQNSAVGGMPGNPYAGQDASAQAMNCACNTCTTILCMDACCSCSRGC